MMSILIRGGTIVRSTGMEDADVFIEGGRIMEVVKGTYPSREADEIISAENIFLMPGLIDCHVHFREPGLTEKGNIESESRSALAGGVTTVCDMPNTVPSTVTVAALADKVRRVSSIGREIPVDVRFFLGVMERRHLLAVRDVWVQPSTELRRLKGRCAGVKIYLDHSTGNQAIASDVLEECFALCGELGILLVAHCEDAVMNAKLLGENMRTDITAHSLLRPPESEERSIAQVIVLARKHSARLHVAHLSTKQGLHLIRQAKHDGLLVTCEVTPHHLFLSTEDYVTLGTLAKMNPPLRDSEHQEALWEGIADGTIDCIATDHAPHTLREKQVQNPLEAPSGVPGVETMLPLLFTVAQGEWPHPHGRSVVSGQLSVSDIVRLCFENPNRIFSLGKQGITEGAPLDVILVDPRVSWIIRGKELHSKCGWTPYEGWKARGKITRLTLPP